MSKSEDWAVIHSSKRHDWRTPQELFKSLDRVFDFKVDAAAGAQNKLCDRFWSESDSALSKDWNVGGWVWVNPPYGKQVKDWFEKAGEEAGKGARVVLLCMACTETKWFDVAWKNCAEIWFLSPRVRFEQPGEKSGPAPKGSAIFIFDRVHVPRVVRLFNWKRNEWEDSAEVLRKFKGTR